MGTEKKESKLKGYFRTVRNGFLSGIGFGVAVVLVFWIAGNLFQSEAKKEIINYELSHVEFDENSGLAIEDHEITVLQNKIVLLGQVKNNGPNNWKHVQIEVELFDSKGKFVDKCSTYVSGTIKEDEIRNFKATCGGCGDQPPVEFSTYEVKIVEAHHDA